MTIQDDSDQPKPEDRFSFGLWTLVKRWRGTRFGDVVRPTIRPVEMTSMLAEGEPGG